MNDQPERSEDFHKRCATLNSSVPVSEVAQLRKELKECADLLNEVRKGEDFECLCHEAAEKAEALLKSTKRP